HPQAWTPTLRGYSIFENALVAEEAGSIEANGRRAKRELIKRRGRLPGYQRRNACGLSRRRRQGGHGWSSHRGNQRITARHRAVRIGHLHRSNDPERKHATDDHAYRTHQGRSEVKVESKPLPPGERFPL